MENGDNCGDYGCGYPCGGGIDRRKSKVEWHWGRWILFAVAVGFLTYLGFWLDMLWIRWCAS